MPLTIYCLPLHSLKRQCSGFSAVGSAHVWGARGRWFESSNPDITKGVAAARFATPFCFCPYLMPIVPALGSIRPSFNPLLSSCFLLNLLFILYKILSLRQPLLAKKRALKLAIRGKLQSCGFVFWLIFDNITCILHHFAFLFGRQFAVFSVPIICFLPLEFHVLTAILPISAIFLMTRKGFIYTIAVYFYAFCIAFSSILPCV